MESGWRELGVSGSIRGCSVEVPSFIARPILYILKDANCLPHLDFFLYSNDSIYGRRAKKIKK